MKKAKKIIIAIVIIFILIITPIVMDSNYGKTILYYTHKSDVFISVESSSLCPWNTYVITTADGRILATGNSYLTRKNAAANPLVIHSNGQPIRVILSWNETYELNPGDSILLQYSLSSNFLFVTVM